MLQQTRVQTVIPYFERFIARFPTPRALATACEDDVLSHWSGLGYYRRARLLVAGVREVVAQYGGQVPKDAAALRALSGVGAYTAGAIASIAYDLPEPIVDGNVARVLARVHRIETPLGERATETALWAHARAWADGERPGAVNQALMELGATLCAKSSPDCAPCPLAQLCRARALGETESLPRPRARAQQKDVSLVAVVAMQGDATYLERSAGTLFSGLYVPPMQEVEGSVADALAALRARHGVGPVTHVGAATHVLTHRRLAIELYVSMDAPSGDTLRRVTRAEIADVGVPTLTRKLLKASGFGETPGASRARTPRADTRQTPRAPRRSKKSPAADR